jgi:hypothetical protein
LQCTEEWKLKVAKKLRFGNSIVNYMPRGHASSMFASPSLSRGTDFMNNQAELQPKRSEIDIGTDHINRPAITIERKSNPS